MILGTSGVVNGDNPDVLWVNENPPNRGFTGRPMCDIVTRGKDWKRFHSGADDRVDPLVPVESLNEGILFNGNC